MRNAPRDDPVIGQTTLDNPDATESAVPAKEYFRNERLLIRATMFN
jgi:hypothetical protein